jgi:hypothetical protein
MSVDKMSSWQSVQAPNLNQDKKMSLIFIIFEDEFSTFQMDLENVNFKCLQVQQNLRFAIDGVSFELSLNLKKKKKNQKI